MYDAEIRAIIAANIISNEPIDTYDAEASLQNIGMDSISFIRIAVEIENHFGFEFPEDKLIIAEAGTIALLDQIVDSAMKDKG